MNNNRLIFRKVVAIVMSAFLTLVLLPVEIKANDDIDETEDTTVIETEYIGEEKENTQLFENDDSADISENPVIENNDVNCNNEITINDGTLVDNKSSYRETIEDFLFVPVFLDTPDKNNEDSENLEALDGQAVYNKLVSQVSNNTMGGKAHPLGYGDHESSALKVATGVQLLTQYDGYESSLKTYKKLNTQKFVTNESNCFDEKEDIFVANNKKDLGNFIDDAGKLAYIQSVSFDPTGCGRNNYVAYVGMDRDSNITNQGYMNKLWVYNAETKKVSKTYSIPSTEWEKDALNNGEFFARNFFSITAGDYDGDGKETLVVFTAQDLDESNLMEFKMVINENADMPVNQNSNIDYTIGFEPLMNHQGILNPDYFEKATHSKQNTDPAKRLYCELASGDVNADGIDDLIAVSGSDSTSNTYLGVLLGDEKGFDNDTKKCLGIFVRPDGANIVSAGVDVGNIDGKTVNEIVVGGYKVTDNVKTLTRVVSAYRVNNAGTGLFGIASKEDSPLNYNSNVKNVFPDNGVWGRREVTCVAFDGQGNPEAVAVDDTVYHLDGGMFMPKHYCAPANNTAKIQPGICTNGTAASYVYSPNDGIDPNGMITFEQLTYTQIFEDKGGYTHPIDVKGTFVRVLGDAKLNNSGILTPSANYKHAYSIYIPYVSGNGKQMMTNLLFNPVEAKETDVVKVRLNAECGSQVLKGTPEPIAILQAAPWFSELGSSYVGATTFGITETVGSGTSSGGSDFIGGGIAQSSQFPIAKQSLTITFKNSINYSCTKQTVNKYTSSFSAGPKDTVVIRLSPADLYVYDTKWGNNEWDEKSVGMTVMRPPLYAQITVDEYNSLVDFMNANIKSVDIPDGAGGTFNITAPKLMKINKSALYLGNEGNPKGYGKIDSEALPHGWETISKGTYVLGYQGGSTTSNYSQEKSQNDSFSQSTSQEFRFELQFGAADKASGLGFWLGGFFTAGSSSSTGTVSITGQGVQTSGTVKNLDSSKDSSYENYGFEWSFGQVMVPLKDNDSHADKQNVPMYGYTLSNVKKGVFAPVITDITKTVSEEGTTCKIKWDNPTLSSGQSVDSYVLYGYDIDGNKRIVAENIIDKSYDYYPNGEEFVSFSVVAKIKEGSDIFDSLASSRKSVFFLEKGEQGPKGENGESAYEIAVDHGFSGTEEEWLLTLKGDQGIDGTSAYELAIQFGFTGSKEEWLISLKGEKGDQGEQGVKGDQGIPGVDGKNGTNGRNGTDGNNGRDGLNGLKGKDGLNGKSAYEIAVDHGFTGTEEEWLVSLKGENVDNSSINSSVISGMSHAYVDENNVLVIVLDDGRDVMIGEVENKDHKSDGMHLKLKGINPETGIKGFIKDWMPMLLALMSLIWNLFDLILILKLDKKLK